MLCLMWSLKLRSEVKYLRREVQGLRSHLGAKRAARRGAGLPLFSAPLVVPGAGWVGLFVLLTVT